MDERIDEPVTKSTIQSINQSTTYESVCEADTYFPVHDEWPAVIF
jgi:hypothetical protein